MEKVCQNCIHYLNNEGYYLCFHPKSRVTKYATDSVHGTYKVKDAATECSEMRKTHCLGGKLFTQRQFYHYATFWMCFAAVMSIFIPINPPDPTNAPAGHLIIAVLAAGVAAMIMAIIGKFQMSD